ncbi:cyclic nucleotide-binding domain-containing protein [Candidatus Fermentibacteria bacterium]|nr:cyclic nucleotide-binding domain-containing protein [Candidatus Fermentibacteria bacterium]
MGSELGFFEPVKFLREEEFVGSCEALSAGEEDEIIDQDSDGTDLYVIRSGRFVVSDTAGEELVIATLTDGDVFGEMSFLRSDSRSATVTCSSPGELLRFSRDSFEELYRSNALLAVRVIITVAQLLARRLAQADSTLSLLSDDSDLRERYEIRRLMGELRGSIGQETEDS